MKKMSNSSGASKEQARVRLLFVVNSLDRGGAERHTWDLARALQDRGLRSAVYGLRPGFELDSEVRGVQLSNGTGNGLLDVASYRKLSRTIKEFRPTLIVAVNERPLLHSYIAARMSGSDAKICVVYHTTIPANKKDKLLSYFYRYLFVKTELTVFVSSNQRDYWRERGLYPQHSLVIHNGVDVDRFNPEARLFHRQRMRDMLQLSNADVVFAIVAGFRPEKNHRQLVDAIGTLRQQGCPAKGLFVGGGSGEAFIRRYVDELGLQESFTFTGSQPDVVPFIAASDVGVLCSTAVETFSLSALETMGMGIPMVMSNIGGASEMVAEGVNGLLFAPKDTGALCEALLSLLNRERRSELGLAARDIVEARFSFQCMVDRYEHCFRKIIAGP